MSTSGTPTSAHLHLHRGWGVTYTAVGLVILAIAAAALVDNLLTGRPVLAVVSIVVGLGLSAYLVKLGLELLVPSVIVDRTGVRGRIDILGQRVDLGWNDITIELDDEGVQGRLRLDFHAGTDQRSVTVNSRSWYGFTDFVLVVATTPAASRALAPAAEQEMLRLLGIQPPSAEPIG